jgi:DNA-binding NarL/FixJ family response regulator
VTPNSTTTTLLLASDFPVFRDFLTTHFEKDPQVQVIGCAKDTIESIQLITTLQPKLAVLDLNIGWGSLCLLLDEIHSRSTCRTLIMSDVLDSSRVIEVLRHGAHGVVPRRATPELLSKSIQTVAAGGFWVSRDMVTDFVHLIRESGSPKRHKSDERENMVENAAAPAAASVEVEAQPAVSEAEIARLGVTKRESQIIGALVDGQTNKDIAATFGISPYTVKHHLSHIYDKVGVYNRVELVLYALNRGLCATNC